MSFAPMRTVWAPERDSIFGDTYDGVPNPLTPHRHPWPTRYHGPNYTVPGVDSTYAQRPYAIAPYMGMGEAPMSPPVDVVVNSLAGAAIGYLVADKESHRPVWAIVGALAGYGMGFIGLLGVAGVGLVMRKD